MFLFVSSGYCHISDCVWSLRDFTIIFSRNVIISFIILNAFFISSGTGVQGILCSSFLFLTLFIIDVSLQHTIYSHCKWYFILSELSENCVLRDRLGIEIPLFPPFRKMVKSLVLRAVASLSLEGSLANRVA